MSSLSSNAIQRFLALSGSTIPYPSDDFDDWMRELGFAELSPAGLSVPTELGILLFGSHPEHTFPQAIFRTEINYGQGEPEIRDFSGPLVEQLPAIVDYIRDKALRLTISRTQATREEQSDFPIEVLREAIANAIIHRDYTMAGAPNYLYIDPERIVVRSPGGPLAPITLEEMARFDVGPLTRNPKIMFVFSQMKLAEQRGIGLRNMRRLPQQGFPLPTFNMQAGTLEVTFGRIKGIATPAMASNKKLTREDQAGLIFLQEKGAVTASEYAEHLEITPKMAQRHLARLIELGLVTSAGSRRWTRYELKRPKGHPKG